MYFSPKPPANTMVDLALLKAVNAARRKGSPDAEHEKRAQSLYGADQRFAVYGSLAPDCPNHHHISHLQGKWLPDYKVFGTLAQSGWAAAIGFPILVLGRDDAQYLPVQLLESDNLNASEWDKLDEFEGNGYLRLLVPVENGAETRVANIYTLPVEG